MQRVFILSLLGVVAAGNALGQVAPARAELPDFDKRTERPRAIPPARRATAAQLQERIPAARVDFDEIVHSPKFIWARDGFLSGRGGQGRGISSAIAAKIPAGDPHRAAKAFLHEHRALFGHGPEVLNQARVEREFVTPHNGMRTVVWQQQLDGIGVFEGVLRSHTTKEGELVNISSHFLPDVTQAAGAGTPDRAALQRAPAITARQAVAIAAENLGEELTADALEAAGAGPAGGEMRQEFKAAILTGGAEVKLVWLPLSGEELRLCWEVVLMSRARGEMFCVLVDTRTGEPMLRRCLTDYLIDASYRVYTSDSPSPFSPGHATPLTNQPPLVPRTLVTFGALDTNASPNGWINDGVNETRGNNVDAHTDRNADNQPDLPRPQGSPFRVFNFSLDLTAQDPTNYSEAAVVQLFYWCNWMHDKLYELGFTEAAGNFQSTNFGRGGVGNDAVQADAQDGGGVNNANFSTASDGSSARMQMYLFTAPTPRRDASLDAEVILHEYTHGLSRRWVVGVGTLQAAGVSEGWSDFYPLSLLSEPDDDPDGTYAFGGYVSYWLAGKLTNNYYFGARRYPYCTDTNKNPLTFKDIDIAQASAHTGIPRNPAVTTLATSSHNIGEVWCSALWQARANLIHKYGYAAGNRLMLRLVTDGMNLSPANPNLLQARDTVLQADQVDNGGVNLGELWAAFAKRGMGNSATSPASTTTTGVHEAFDVPILPLIITIPASATEGDGVLLGQGSVKLSAPPAANLEISLASSDTSEITVPAVVTVAAGETNATFDVTVVDDAQLDGTQTVAVTASPSPGYSAAIATMQVLDDETLPVIVAQPSDRAVSIGGTATFAVEAGGTPPLSYQWTFAEADLPGAANGLLVLTDVQLEQAGNYAVLVSNAFGSVLSSNAILTVHGVAPFVTSQPTDQTVTVSNTATFAVEAGGTPPLSYQWVFGSTYPWGFDDTNLNWATSSLLVLTNVLSTRAGPYWAVITNSYGSATSAVATLTVGVPLQISRQPASQSAPLGCSVTFSVAAAGTDPLNYQWWKDGLTLGGQTNTSLTLTDIQVSDLGSYSVVVTNAFGSLTSSPALLAEGYHPPVAGADTVQRFASGGVAVNAADLLANDTDPSGDSMTIVEVSPSSGAGGTVGLIDNWIYYAPPPGFTKADTFTYTVSDGHCGTDAGTVTVKIKADDLRPSNFAIQNLGDGSVRLTFAGMAGCSYWLEYKEHPSDPWQTLIALTANGYGVCEHVDWSPTNTPTRFYRAVCP